MVVFGKSGFICGKWLYSGKVVVFGQNGCIWAKVVVFGQNGCTWAKVVVSGQNGCIWAKVVAFWQSVCYLAKLLYLSNGVVIGHSGCIRASDFIKAKWL